MKYIVNSLKLQREAMFGQGTYVSLGQFHPVTVPRETYRKMGANIAVLLANAISNSKLRPFFRRTRSILTAGFRSTTLVQVILYVETDRGCPYIYKIPTLEQNQHQCGHCSGYWASGNIYRARGQHLRWLQHMANYLATGPSSSSR